MRKYFSLFLLLFLGFGIHSFAQTTSTLPEGKIISKQGNLVKIAIGEDCQTFKTSEFTLEKHFTQVILGAEATGWLSVALIEIMGCSESVLTVLIVEEQSEILVNGEKVDHFKIGNVVKLTELDPKE